MKPKRPFSVTILALGVLIISGLHLLQLAQAIQQWNFLKELPLSVPPSYLVATGLVFGAGGLPISLGLWVGKPWVVRWTQIYVGSVLLQRWVDQIFLSANRTVLVDWPFDLGLTIILLIYMFGTLAVPASEAFFSDANNPQIKRNP